MHTLRYVAGSGVPADVVREAVVRMPPHVQQYVVEQMRADLAGGRMSGLLRGCCKVLY